MEPHEDAVKDFLGDKPSAQELREWREALQQRLHRMREDLVVGDEAHTNLSARISDLEEKIAALQEEEAVTGFVEESVRAVVADHGGNINTSSPSGSGMPAWADTDMDEVPEELT
jgi:septal ring factor EnvC (AmiA/AmiB activator)